MPELLRATTARRVFAALTTSALSRLVSAGLPTVVGRLPGGVERFDRVNHRGERVTLLEGPVAAIGTAAGLALARDLPPQVRLAGAVTALGAGAFGALDDLVGTAANRGLRGHLAALRHGTVTTGAVKIAGLAATGWVGARLVGHRGGEALLSGAVIAGAANLVNLLDLRPGRALKAVLAHAPTLAMPGLGGAVLAAPVGAAAGVLGDDLGERSMLGDTGANSLGAVLGLGVCVGYGRLGRAVHLLAIAGLTLASERVSFTDVIARTPPLRFLDELGRRTPPAAR